ncbi:hypothetical protein BG006_004831 [Podila minutissima]|uniref:Uncharacterized protein n=1 Tax=Podila minutissima TaxID=64525 RepID=A0A9P5SPR9_9FUNG|nr:hypothetical protein BG006_004831 [Podila minutissima]
MRISWAIQVVTVVCLVAHSVAEIKKADHFPVRYGLVKRGEEYERPRARPGPSRTSSAALPHRHPDHDDHDDHDDHRHPPGKKPTPTASKGKPTPSKGKPAHKDPDHKPPHKPDHKPSRKPTKKPTKSTGKHKPKPTKSHSKPHKPHKPTSSPSKTQAPKPTEPSVVEPLPVAPSLVAPPPVVSLPPTVPVSTRAPVAPVAPSTSPSDGAGSPQTVRPTPALVAAPPTQSKMSGDSASSIGVIIGALVGTIALVGLVALGVYRRREKKHAVDESLAPGPDGDDLPELEAPRTAFRHQSFMALVKDAATGFYAPGTPGAEAAAAAAATGGGAPVYVARAGSGLAGELSRQNSARSQNSQRSHHTLHNRRSGSYSPNGSMNGVTPGAMPPLAHLGGRS